MTDSAGTLQIRAAVISDRGLSEKRPLNEDSYLSDPARRIFAVADGVGGANAGEVASQTAMEVLDDAFRHHEPGADIEDLMELAIQRANASIHQMAREHPKLSAMATTVVALHLDGHIATIGHVGDSRLYRLTPDGRLHRDTADHSVVEEEVRAGRMTPEQAATHPSRNVISRALGAEPSVEVDMKILEVEEGTSFLLCSDGITRHIPDNEIREILSSYEDLEEACTEMKRRCYERGAEDNLTAVVIRIGSMPEQTAGDEQTLVTERSDLHDTLPGLPRESAPAAPQQQPVGTTTRLTPASRIAFPAPAAANDSAAPAPSVPFQPQPAAPPRPQPAQASEARSSSGSIGRVFVVLLLLAGVGVAAYFAGRYQAGREQAAAEDIKAQTTNVLTPPDAASEFDRRRREIDRDPKGGLARLERESNGRPTDSADPEFLSLYGRALLLLNRHDEAGRAFKLAAEKLKDRSGRDPLKVETRIAAAAAAVRSNNQQTSLAASKDLEDVFEMDNKNGSPAMNTGEQTNVSNVGEQQSAPPQ